MTRVRVFVMLVFAALPGGCAGAQSVLDPAGEQAGRLFSLLQMMIWVCGGMYAPVLLFLGWSIVRVPRGASGGGDPVVDPADHGLGTRCSSGRG